MTTIRIIAAVLDTDQLTLYQADGETISIRQGDPRIRRIIDTITPLIAANNYADIELGDVATTPYAAFQEKTNGLVKFFRVAKKAVQHLLGGDEDRIEPTSVGQVPLVPVVTKANETSVEYTMVSPHTKAIDEIMAHAEPLKPSFNNTASPDHTVVAVVGEGAQAKVVPGVEALEGQFKHAAKLGSTQGVENLIRRLGEIIASGSRGHSVQDVLRFLEKGDLPIADDGSIIAYKVLRKHPSEAETFVDCHTKRIPQKVGDYVCVAENLVDRDRRNECSNGLHIARRGYLNQFTGDVCILAKIAPEDVVTVPHGDPNKVRVCGYHILGQIQGADWTKLRNNQPMTDSGAAQTLLAQAISGRHVGKLRKVLVTQQQGGGVQITKLDRHGVSHKAPKPTEQAKAKAVALDDARVTEKKTEAVDPKAVAKQVAETKSQAIQPTRKDRARELFTVFWAVRTKDGARAAAQALEDLRKKSKVSWSALGLSKLEIDAVIQALKQPKTETIATADMNPAKNGEPTVSHTIPVSEPKPAAAPLSSRRAKAVLLLSKAESMSASPADRRQAAKDLIAFKKASKVSWSALGISDLAVISITKIANSKPMQPLPKTQPEKAPAKAKSGKKTNKPAPQVLVQAGTTRVEVARMLFDNAIKDRTQWAQLWLHKRKAKQSWEALGFSKDEIRRIENSKPDHI